MSTSHATTQALIGRAPVIPVVVLQRPEHAVPLARALLAGGVDMLEVTLRTPAALAAIEVIARGLPQVLVGAGTIRSVDDARAARDAGARFGVSPGYSAAIAAACRVVGLPLLPGAVTATEVMSAQADGFSFVKFFPAETSGGAAALKALHGPFPDMRFCPTGGLTPDNAPTYLALPNVPVVGGTWLTPADAIERGDWERITRLARESTRLRG